VKPRVYKVHGAWWVQTLDARAGFATFPEAIDYVDRYWIGLRARADLFLLELPSGIYVQ
jgi:hypothetical protein